MSAIQLIDPAPKDEPTQQRALTVATPDQLIALAVERGADLAYVEKLMELQERWAKAEAAKAYNQAFADFKAEAVKVIRNRQVTDGPLRGKSYAELYSVVDAVTPALSRHGLSASWKLTRDEKDWLEVTCTLKHALGHSESVSMGGPPDAGGAKNAIQARASTISYLERYTLKAICGVAEHGDDDDGRGGAKEKEAGENESLLDDGRTAALEGMATLVKWWGGLTAKQRNALNKDYPNLRQAAARADRDQGGQP